MSRLTTSRTGRVSRRALVLTALAAAGAVSVLPAGAASAADAPQSPVIVGPLLQIFTFGADVGIPTGCQAGSAAIGSGASYLNLAQQSGVVINKINSGCTTVQVYGDTFIAVGNKKSAPLAVLNPTVNPMIGQAATSVSQAGTDYGPAIAPFGPTIAGLGATINFFQGH
jgi:hypothetical protein